MSVASRRTTRRQALAAGAALLTGPAAGAAASPAPAPADSRVVSRDGGRNFVRVTFHRDGRVGEEAVPRWQVPAVVDRGPQPAPSGVRVSQVGERSTSVVRVWSAEAQAACRLCSRCNAEASAAGDGSLMCSGVAAGLLTADRAALAREVTRGEIA